MGPTKTDKETTGAKDGSKVDAKTALLDSAKRVFAEKGYDGATVKDLADAAGVNVSLVSYHFGGKEELYKACLVNFAEQRVEAMERILKAPVSVEDFRIRLRLFADEMTEVHLREPSMCKIIHRDLGFMTNAVVQELFLKVFYRVFVSLVDFLKAAERARIIRKFRDTEVATTLIFSSLIGFLDGEPKRKAIGKPSIQDPKYREEFLSTWLDITVEGLLLRGPQKETDKK